MFLAVVAIILTLILVVGLHEAGHALIARIFSVKIKRISIGFGRPLAQWTSKSGCEWVWGMWPLGGYVHLLNTRISPVEPAELTFCFDKKSCSIRLLILVAGAFVNFLTAWLALVLIFLIGLSVKPPQIQTVEPNSIAAEAGILAGDQILAINGQTTPSWQEVGMELIILWGNKDVKITVKQVNKNDLKNLLLDLSTIKFTGRERSLLNSIGISPNLSVANDMNKSPTIAEAMYQANKVVVHLLYFFLMILKQLFSGVIPFAILLGPLGLFAASVASLTQGIVVFMYFIASFSLAVGLVNLFPIPGLDGGLILYTIIEKIRGKPISVATEVLVHRLVLILFCVVLAQLLLNDLQRFYS